MIASIRNHALSLALASLLAPSGLAGCSRGHEAQPPPNPEAGQALAEAPAAAEPPSGAGGGAGEAEATAPPAAPKAAPLDRSRYPWLADKTLKVPEPHDTLEARFPAPEGFTRVPVEEGSFGAFLRGLPLAPPDAPVLTFQGKVLREPGVPNVAAVAAIDVGTGDLQQCADSVIRMHAEWLWSRGRRDMTYRAAGGQMMPFARWDRGERLVAHGNSLDWAMSGPSGPADHASFRKYLDQVFNWANTVALARQAAPVAPGELRPGDFVVMPGNPGHAVLFLDLARSADGKLVALLGQGFMPAQSFHVLRPFEAPAWFPVEPGGAPLDTPFWSPFPWSLLRRLPG